MKLIDNWRTVLLRAWTVWLAVLAALAGVVEAVHADVVALLPLLQPYLSDGQAAKLAAICAAAVPLARIVKQVRLELGP